MTTPQCSEPPSGSVGLRAPVPAAVSARETVFTVLGNQARSRSLGGLWTTAVAGALNAALVWWQYPALSWLAAGFVTTAAYGAWGLLDRAIVAKEARPSDTGVTADSLPEMRDLIAVLGTGAAVWAVLGFMAAALGNWNH